MSQFTILQQVQWVLDFTASSGDGWVVSQSCFMVADEGLRRNLKLSAFGDLMEFESLDSQINENPICFLLHKFQGINPLPILLLPR